MTYPQIFRYLVLIVVLAAFTLAGWSAHSWFSSQPVASAAVLGISTEATPGAFPQLDLYPSATSDALPSINAKEFVLYNPDSGKVLAKSDNLDPVPIASTTKLMTTYLVATKGDTSDIVTVSQAGASQIGSLMNLYEDEHISVLNLLYGTLMVSGNDGAYTLAEYLGGKLLNDNSASSEAKVARFVEEMNATVKKLDLQNTHYLDPAGLNDDGHSNALDLAKLASLVNNQPLLRKIIGTAQLTVTNAEGTYRHDLRNSDRLTADYFYEGNIGGKTGNTPAAGHCLVTSATRNGITLTAVILSTYSEANEASALEARKLLDYGFSNFRWQ